MNDILNYVFSVIFKIPFQFSYLNIPNCFGIFTTIKTKNKVHGSVGNWKYDYTLLNDAQKIELLRQVSVCAMYKDSRNTSDIFWDPDAILEISLMYSPVILKSLPLIFDNKKYGIIANNTVTFLPNVFQTIETKELITHLKKQTDKDMTIFTIYSTYILSDTFINLSYNFYKLYWNYVGTFFNLNYGYFFPHEVYVKKDFMIIDRDPDNISRNISTIGELINIHKIYPVLSANTIQKMSNDLKSYDFKNLNEYQKHFFSTINNECMEFGIETLEKNFQLGQFLLTNAKIAREPTNRELDILLQEIKYQPIRLNSIFRFNLQIQSVCINKNPYIEHLKILLSLFYSWYKQYYSEKLETNYIVVTFEFLSFQKRFLKSYQNEMRCFLFKIFIDLAKRFDIKIGLFRFLSGKCRVDITGHFLNAILQNEK